VIIPVGCPTDGPIAPVTSHDTNAAVELPTDERAELVIEVLRNGLLNESEKT
jgi:hypothetical protein